MSTLVDSQINAWALGGGIDRFDFALVNPASINLRIGTTVMIEDIEGGLYSVDISDKTKEDPFVVEPGEWILTHTAEIVTLPPDIEAEVCLRSSAARLGWNHALAAYIDPGWQGSITLELKNDRRFAHLPLYPGQQLVQLRLRNLSREPISHYGFTGRYQGDASVSTCKDDTLI